MVKNTITDMKLNNKGVSLVELIVAIAVGMIVAGAIAGLITFSTRMYSNEMANTVAQQELQTSINQIMDGVMSSSGMVIGQNASGSEPYTDYAAFGTFKTKSNGKVDFDGIVLVSGAVTSGRFNIYMNKISVTDKASSLDAVQAAVQDIKDNFGQNPNPYLLAQGASRFRIEPLKNNGGEYVNFSNTDHKFDNPVTVEIEMNFEKDGMGKVINKHIKDEVYMRNASNSDIYFGTTGAEVQYQPRKRY